MSNTENPMSKLDASAHPGCQSLEVGRLPIVPVILAAGDSSRMGYPKAILPFKDGTFLTLILRQVEPLGLYDPLIILGNEAHLIKPWIRDRRAQILINPDPQRGQLSSIQIALAKLGASAAACLVWPVDHPAVPSMLAQDLIGLFCQTGAPLVLPVFSNRRGHPVVFSRTLFHELLNAPAEQGAKGVVMSHLEEAMFLETAEAAVIEDIDTPDDYYNLTGETLVSALARRGTSPPS